MRVISQDGYTDIPYEDFVFSATDDWKIKVAKDVVYNTGQGKLRVIAEYSSREKALKAMELLREHNEGVIFLKTVINTEKGNLFVSSLSKTDFNKLTQNYFQFPQDDEIEV